MTKKFGISEKDELILLRDWRDNNTYSVVPKNLKNKITDQKGAELFSHYSDMGNFQKEIDNRIKELETKFQNKKEQGFFYLIWKNFKEEFAKNIALILIGIIIGFIIKSIF